MSPTGPRQVNSLTTSLDPTDLTRLAPELADETVGRLTVCPTIKSCANWTEALPAAGGPLAAALQDRSPNLLSNLTNKRTSRADAVG